MPRLTSFFRSPVAWGSAALAAAAWITPAVVADRAERPLRDAQPLPKNLEFRTEKDSTDDPVGDHTGAVDLTGFAALVSGDALILSASFATPISAPDSGAANAVNGFIDIDADQDGSTGRTPWTDFLSGTETTGMGNEFYIDLFSFDNGAVDVVDDINQVVVGTATATFGPMSFVVTLPAALLGGDTEVHLALAVTDEDENLSDYAPDQGALASDSTAFLLQGDRFSVEVDFRGHNGEQGPAELAVRSDDSAVLYFFDEDNWELLIKIIDACDFNDRFWVYFAATTDVEFSVTVTDTQTGADASYFNELGQRADAVTDSQAFATCP